MVHKNATAAKSCFSTETTTVKKRPGTEAGLRPQGEPTCKNANF